MIEIQRINGSNDSKKRGGLLTKEDANSPSNALVDELLAGLVILLY